MFDINTAIGHWPFRPLPIYQAAPLRQHLESHGISGAAVASTQAVFYHDCQAGNLELSQEIAAHRDFFVGVATLNPNYAAAERDLEYCISKLDFRALRLVPRYHNYDLLDGSADRLLTRAGELNIPVLIPNELVNYRQKHWLEPDKPLGSQAVITACERFPQTNFILMEGGFGAGTQAPANLYLEISRYQSCYGQALASIAAKLGADHLLFGSGAPFKEVEPALLKLHHCQINEQDKQLIANNNARKLLRLEDK